MRKVLKYIFYRKIYKLNDCKNLHKILNKCELETNCTIILSLLSLRTDQFPHSTLSQAYQLYKNKLSVRFRRRETGLSPPLKYFADRSKAVLLLWIIKYFYLVFVMLSYARVCLLCIVANCWERADLFALVCDV